MLMPSRVGIVTATATSCHPALARPTRPEPNRRSWPPRRSPTGAGGTTGDWGIVRRVRCGVLLVIVSVVAAGAAIQVPARADAPPTVASGGGPSSGWVAIEWSIASGAQGSLTVLNSNVLGPGFASLYLYDASDRALSGGNVGITGNMGDAHLEASVPPAPPAEQTVTT